MRQGDGALYIVLNAASLAIDFVLPALSEYARWTLLLATAPKARPGHEFPASAKMQAPPRSVMVFSGTA